MRGRPGRRNFRGQGLNFIVDTAASLVSALATAASGALIQLAPGTYASVSIEDVKAAGVTITSLDPENPAVIHALDVRESAGITFTDVVFQPVSAHALKVVASQDVHFSRVHVHGSLDDDPQNDHQGLLIRGSSNVSVADSEFEQLTWGLSHLDSDGVTVAGNRFHDIQIDGVRGGGSSNVRIDGNSFRDFYPEPRDHNDAIQFWTTRTDAPARNITITNNVFERGDGAPSQGILMRDESGELAFENVVIEGNLILGALYNGISVNGGAGVRVEDNVVQGFSDQKSWLRLVNVEGASVRNNAASDLVIGDGTSGVVQADNQLLPLASDAGLAAAALWRSLNASDLPAIRPPLGPGELPDLDLFAPSGGVFDGWLPF